MKNAKMQKCLKDMTKELFYTYLSTFNEENINELLPIISDDFTIIGTGKHEIYTNLKSFLNYLAQNQEQSINIKFEVLDEWYSCIQITDETFLVYGTLWIIEKDIEHKPIYVEMDTRFSVIYKVTDGKISLIHLHQSLPNLVQSKDDYYAKTITERTKEAFALAQEYKLKAEKDLMTGLYNRHFLETYVDNQLNINSYGYFYIFDLDNFKSVNDTYGHIKGDEVILEFVELLTNIFINDVIIGRLGGDEFVVFSYKEQTKDDVENKAKQVTTLCKDINSCSIGIAKTIENNETFQSLYKKADYALYYSKHKNSGNFSWFEK